MASGRRPGSGAMVLSRSGALKWNAAHNDDKEEEENYSVDDLAERLEDSASLGNDDIRSPIVSHRREPSAFPSNRSEMSQEDKADAALSEDGEFTGSAYQASISSGEEIAARGFSRRTLKSNRPREFPAENARHPAYLWRGDNISSSDGISSTWSGPVEYGRSSPSNFTVSSDFTSSSGLTDGGRYTQAHQGPIASNFHELDPDMSRRMDGIRNQRMSAQLYPQGGMRASARSDTESVRASTTSSGALQTIHCCLHCRTKTCGAFSFLPAANCCDNGTCKSCSHCCCYPSVAQGKRCHSYTAPPARSRNPSHDEGRDHTPRFRDNRRAVWPVYGGAGFLQCYECSNLLLIPANIHFLGGGCNAMRCGQCSQIITFSLVDRTRIVRSERSEFPGQIPGRDEPFAGQAYAGPSDNWQGDDRSVCSNEYASTEYETDTGQVKNADKNTKKKQKALHRMMGYFSARQILD